MSPCEIAAAIKAFANGPGNRHVIGTELSVLRSTVSECIQEHAERHPDLYWKGLPTRIGVVEAQLETLRRASEAQQIVSTPVHPEPDAVQQQFVGGLPEYNCPPGGIPLPPEIPDPDALRFVEDPSRPGYLRRCHNPHGLVAFYTDTP